MSYPPIGSSFLLRRSAVPLLHLPAPPPHLSPVSPLSRITYSQPNVLDPIQPKALEEIILHFARVHQPICDLNTLSSSFQKPRLT